MINICGCVCIPGAKQGMLELIPQTLFFLERASVNTEGVWVPMRPDPFPQRSDQVKGGETVQFARASPGSDVSPRGGDRFTHYEILYQ